MRYDDPNRPKSEAGAEAIPLQVSRSPLPCITLIRPMEVEVIVARCRVPGAQGFPCNNSYPCERCEHVTEWKWGWLCCIHAHREGSRFGYHTAVIADIGQFSLDFLEDPEAALRRYFKYEGPEERKPVDAPRVYVDLWGEEENG